jgi:hypothetical protein
MGGSDLAGEFSRRASAENSQRALPNGERQLRGIMNTCASLLSIAPRLSPFFGF